MGSRIKRVAGAGTALQGSLRRKLELGLEADLAQVRTHTDGEADSLARSVNAVAFTSGQDIFFRHGAFDPHSDSGLRLLAHEAAHTVQQAQGQVNGTPLPQGIALSEPGDTHECAAEQAADRVMEGSRSGVVQQSISRRRSRSGSTTSITPGVGRQAVQRYSYGASPPAGAVVVPVDHRPRVDAAMNILAKKTSDRRCKEFFKDNCTAGLGSKELEDALNNAEIYHVPKESELFGSSTTRTVSADPRKISYNLTAFRIGRWELASTLLHEMFHTCILGTIPDEEVTAETAVEKCHLFTPFILEVNPRTGPVGTLVTIRGFEFGPRQASVDRVLFGGVDAGMADSWVLSNVDSMVRIKIRVPAGATSGPVVVENNGIPSNAANFTVT